MPSIAHPSKILAALIVAALFASPTRGDAPRVLPPGELPNDARLGPLKDLDGYFPFTASASREEWTQRAEHVRRRVLVSMGLWPMPEKTPAQAVIHGRMDMGDYTIEKVYFESYPGHYVTGNLYRPVGRDGPLPAVLCPHGHWSNGRFHDAGRKNVREQIVAGGERFEDGGRSPLQSRCVQLARMGCVVFHYDMLGYADSVQIPSAVAHGFKDRRPAMETPADWGFFSPQAELRMQNIMGLQTYNSLRALDFLGELPDVDPARIAVTGASGGGTQTFILCAIDPRPAVAFPAVMVSTAMQGGCTCENAVFLRVGTGNVELAAMFAPKPLGMTAADDWTREMTDKGFPELKAHYEQLYDAGGRVRLTPLVHFGHNYNYVSRAAMYAWLNKHLELGWEEPIVEEDYRRLTAEELSVWNDDHLRPAGGEDHERSLLRGITETSDRQIAALRPTNAESLEEYRDTIGGALEVMIGRRPPGAQDLEFIGGEEHDQGDWPSHTALIRNRPAGEELPTLFLTPKSWNRQVVVWIDVEGKAGLHDSSGAPRAAVRSLLERGFAVVGVDLFQQGEFLADGQPVEQTRVVDNPRAFAGYTFGYNPTLFVQRVHDILTVASFLKQSDKQPEKIHLVGLGGAGPWVAVAGAAAGDAVNRLVVDTAGFRFAELRSYRDPGFLPGAVKYGDLPGLLALAAPHPLWLAGEGGEAPQVVAAAYAAIEQGDQLELYQGDAAQTAVSAAAYLIDHETRANGD